MTEVANPPSTSQEPVPLDTIPISPEGGIANGGENGEKAEYVNTDPVTVFHDADNFNVKHPLMNVWTLWFLKPPSGKGDNWAELLKEVITFDSVEEFWGIYNNITPVSELALKSDYNLFKKGVRPEWEDPQNKHGGRWSYQVKAKERIDEMWLHVMLAAIGETLEDEGDNEVMGVVVNVRKAFYRIGVWTRTIGKPLPGSKDAAEKSRTFEQGKAVLEKIGKRFKETLAIREEEGVEFLGHTDSARAGSTRASAKFTV